MARIHFQELARIQCLLVVPTMSSLASHHCNGVFWRQRRCVVLCGGGGGRLDRRRHEKGRWIRQDLESLSGSRLLRVVSFETMEEASWGMGFKSIPLKGSLKLVLRCTQPWLRELPRKRQSNRENLRRNVPTTRAETSPKTKKAPSRNECH